MKRYWEYGLFIAALLTLICLVVAFFSGLTINLTVIFISIAGGFIAGLIVAVLMIYCSPGEHIPEGEEDNYIKR